MGQSGRHRIWGVGASTEGFFFVSLSQEKWLKIIPPVPGWLERLSSRGLLWRSADGMSDCPRVLHTRSLALSPACRALSWRVEAGECRIQWKEWPRSLEELLAWHGGHLAHLRYKHKLSFHTPSTVTSLVFLLSTHGHSFISYHPRAVH